MIQLGKVCGWVGWWLTPTTYIQLAGAGSTKNWLTDDWLIYLQQLCRHTGAQWPLGGILVFCFVHFICLVFRYSSLNILIFTNVFTSLLFGLFWKMLLYSPSNFTFSFTRGHCQHKFWPSKCFLHSGQSWGPANPRKFSLKLAILVL